MTKKHSASEHRHAPAAAAMARGRDGAPAPGPTEPSSCACKQDRPVYAHVGHLGAVCRSAACTWNGHHAGGCSSRVVAGVLQRQTCLALLRRCPCIHWYSLPYTVLFFLRQAFQPAHKQHTRTRQVFRTQLTALFQLMSWQHMCLTEGAGVHTACQKTRRVRQAHREQADDVDVALGLAAVALPRVGLKPGTAQTLANNSATVGISGGE